MSTEIAFSVSSQVCGQKNNSMFSEGSREHIKQVSLQLPLLLVILGTYWEMMVLAEKLKYFKKEVGSWGCNDSVLYFTITWTLKNSFDPMRIKWEEPGETEQLSSGCAVTWQTVGQCSYFQAPAPEGNGAPSLSNSVQSGMDNADTPSKEQGWYVYKAQRSKLGSESCILPAC